MPSRLVNTAIVIANYPQLVSSHGLCPLSKVSEMDSATLAG